MWKQFIKYYTYCHQEGIQKCKGVWNVTHQATFQHSYCLVLIIMFEMKRLVETVKKLGNEVRNEVVPHPVHCAVACCDVMLQHKILFTCFTCHTNIIQKNLFIQIQHMLHFSSALCAARSEPKHPRRLWMGSPTYCRILGVWCSVQWKRVTVNSLVYWFGERSIFNLSVDMRP